MTTGTQQTMVTWAKGCDLIKALAISIAEVVKWIGNEFFIAKQTSRLGDVLGRRIKISCNLLAKNRIMCYTFLSCRIGLGSLGAGSMERQREVRLRRFAHNLRRGFGFFVQIGL